MKSLSASRSPLQKLHSREYTGGNFLANDLQLGGTWIQCSYNGNIRKQYPGIGYTYNHSADVFIDSSIQVWVERTNYE